MFALEKAFVDIDPELTQFYGIEWATTDGILKARTVCTTDPSLIGFTIRSQNFTFGPGEGMPGECFQKQAVSFVMDVQDVEGSKEHQHNLVTTCHLQSRFVRRALAQQFGVRSVLLLPSPDGVIEIGTKEKLKVMPQICGPRVREIVRNAGLEYGLEWELRRDGGLQVRGRFDKHAPSLKEDKMTRTYAMESYNMILSSHGGHRIGKVWESGEVAFIPDVQQLTPEEYPRAPLAKEFGIRSLIFLPVPGGILELGTTELLPAMPMICTDPLQQLCNKVGAAYGVVWSDVAGALSVVEHCVVAGSDREGWSNFALRSYSKRVAVGQGLIGKAYQDRASRLVMDVRAMPEETSAEFVRRDPQFARNLRTVALVLERDVGGDVIGIWELGFAEQGAAFLDVIVPLSGADTDARSHAIYEEICTAFLQGGRYGVA